MNIPLGRRAGTVRGARAALVALAAAAVSATACAERGSDIAVVYRGDVSTWRSRLRVTLGSGARARVVVPAFPSAVKADAVPTHGVLPIAVAVLGGTGDTVARLSAPRLTLAPKTSYGVNVVVSEHRPAQTRCSGEWNAAAVAPPAAESLYVSVTTGARGAAAANCDD